MRHLLAALVCLTIPMSGWATTWDRYEFRLDVRSFKGFTNYGCYVDPLPPQCMETAVGVVRVHTDSEFSQPNILMLSFTDLDGNRILTREELKSEMLGPLNGYRFGLFSPIEQDAGMYIAIDFDAAGKPIVQAPRWEAHISDRLDHDPVTGLYSWRTYYRFDPLDSLVLYAFDSGGAYGQVATGSYRVDHIPVPLPATLGLGVAWVAALAALGLRRRHIQRRTIS